MPDPVLTQPTVDLDAPYDTLDDECPICGGEGFVFECFDGFCADADIGCDDCTRPCECSALTPEPRP